MKILVEMNEVEFERFRLWRAADDRLTQKRERLKKAAEGKQTPIDVLGLSRRARTAAREAGADSVEQMLVIEETEWLMLCGRVTHDEIKKALQPYVTHVTD